MIPTPGTRRIGSTRCGSNRIAASPVRAAPTLPVALMISTRRVGAARTGDAAIRLLPHLVEPMRRVPGVGIIGEIGTGQLKRAVRPGGAVDDPWVGPRRPTGPSGPGRQQMQVIRFERWLDRCQLCVREAGERWQCR